MAVSLFITKDKSHTLYSEKYKAHYHSLYGSIEEAIHVFISAGLYHLSTSGYADVSIFEMGFGTGLNAYLTYVAGQRLGINISYHTIESDPVNSEIYSELNFDKILGYGHQELFKQMHTCSWDSEHTFAASFKFLKIHKNITEFKPDKSYDLIYYDAFAPSCQPYLWSPEIHSPLYRSLNPGGCLVTYCSQGQFKRTLETLGYSIEKLNGPAKKREMIRATKPK